MLRDRILKLKQEISIISVNPVLDAFNIKECEGLDDEYYTDDFVKEKIDKCLNYLKNLTVSYDPKYNSAYEEYNEGIIYQLLKSKFSTQRIPENVYSTPDFHIWNTGEFSFDINAELKSLSFLDGNLNYRNAQDSGLNAKIQTEEKLKEGHKIVFSEVEISPFFKNNKVPSTRELIEIYIDKINNNIKRGQFEEKETVLIVDIKQLVLGSDCDQSSIALYQDILTKSIGSGVLWNTAFGKTDNLIFQQIEFEGRNNVDSELTKNGILVDHEYVKAILFSVYGNNEERKFIGFIRQKDTESQIMNFIFKFCDFYNDEYNSEAWKILN